jgi:hypothetical protein
MTRHQKLKAQANKVAQNQIVIILIGGSLLILLTALIRDSYPLGVDWEYTFSQVSNHWRNPFVIPTFTNPPWVIALLPHAWLPMSWGNALNFLLNVTVLILVINRYEGKWHTYLMVFTCPFFFDLARTNNIEWIPLSGLLLPHAFGIPLLLIKPQAMAGIILIWVKKEGFRILIPTAVVFVLSLLIWGFWFWEMGLPDNVSWNFSMWPVGIPLGLYMLYRAFKEDNELIAAAATPFLVPYIAPYSLAGLMALLGGKYKREVFYLYVGIWAYFIIQLRRNGL